MRQPRPCPNSGAVELSVLYKLRYTEDDPFLETWLKLSNFLSFSNVFRETIPLGSTPVTVAVLGQGQVGVGDDDPLSPVVSGQYCTEILWFHTASDHKCWQSWIVKHKLVNCNLIWYEYPLTPMGITPLDLPSTWAKNYQYTYLKTLLCLKSY